MDPLFAASELAEKIREKLLNEEVFRDNPLTENDLADEFGVSRMPIRLALTELEKAGVVERRKRKGVYLRLPSVSEVAAVYDIRSVLEGFAARLAREHLSSEDLAELAALAEQYQRHVSLGDFAEAEVHDAAFHRLILDASGNPLLRGMMSSFRVMEQTFKMRLTIKQTASPPASPFSHDVVVSALEQADGDECERVMRGHIQWSKQQTLERALGTKLPLPSASAPGGVKAVSQ